MAQGGEASGRSADDGVRAAPAHSCADRPASCVRPAGVRISAGVLAIGACIGPSVLGPAGCGPGSTDVGTSGDTGERTNGRPFEAVAILGEGGRRAGQLAFPRGCDVHVDADGRVSLYIVDKSARIQRFDLGRGRAADLRAATPAGIDPAETVHAGLAVAGFSMPESAVGKPTGLTVGPHPGDASRQVLYVADTHYQRVLVYDLPRPGTWAFDQPPEPVLSWGSFGARLGEFIYPTDVAIWRDERGQVARVYVSEYGGNDRVTCFEPRVTAATGPGGGEPLGIEMVPLFAFGHGEFSDEIRAGSGLGAQGDTSAGGDGPRAPELLLSRPQSIAVDQRAGEVIVVDSANHRIGRFTLDGVLIAWLGGGAGTGVEAQQFRYPYGVALLPGGEALIAELGNRVQRVDLKTGQTLERYGRAGRGPGELSTPWGVAVFGRYAAVLDSGNMRTQFFELPRAVAGGWAGTEGEG